MARYRILAWQDIPAQVQATGDTGAKVNRQLPGWFGAEIDRVAMRDGLADTDAGRILQAGIGEIKLWPMPKSR